MTAAAQTIQTIRKSFDALSGSFLITDSTGVVLYANRPIEQRTGYSVAEVIGKKPGRLWGGNMSQTFYKELWDVIANKQQPFVAEVDNQRKDGTIHREHIHIAPVVSAQSHKTYFIEIHPTISAAQEQVFQKEFSQVLSQRSFCSRTFFDWLTKHLGGEHTIISDAALDDLSSVLEEIFIAPTVTQYQARHDDQVLIEQAKQTPHEFSHLYTKYCRAIFSYLLSRVSHDKHIAADLTQETFYKAFAHLSSYRSTNANYLTYLMRIAHNLLVNHYRAAARHKTVPISDQLPDSNDPVRRVLESTIWESLAPLTNIEQQVITMKYREGLRVHDIATALDRTENAIKLHLSRARKKLRRLM